MKTLIRHGRVIDPSQNLDQDLDLHIEGDRVVRLSLPSVARSRDFDDVIDATGCVVAPGFIDLHVHLRDPGQTEKEDIASGTASAVAGGFTSVLCMPNTVPVNDSVQITREIIEKARATAKCRVFPIGAVTLGQGGKKLAPLAELKAAGCVAFSDDGCPVNDARVMREALILAKELDSFIIEHCEEKDLSAQTTIHNGDVAKELGVEGIPRAAETVDVARSLMLAVELNAPLHLAHLSCEESVKLLMAFKGEHQRLTAEVTPHHLFLTEEAIRQHGADAKMNPPLRLQRDCDAMQQALIDGQIDVVATDHAPHTSREKSLPFEKAPNGIVGLETALPLLLRLVANEAMTLTQVIRVMAWAPAQIAKLEGGTLQEGALADVVVFDPQADRVFQKEESHSKSSNSPFWGERGVGQVRFTLVGGKTVYRQG